MSRRLAGAVIVLGVLWGCATSDQKAEKKEVQREMRRLAAEIERGKKQPAPPSQGINAQTQAHENRVASLKVVGEQYEQFLASPGGTREERLQAMRRLADLSVELEREHFLVAMGEYEDQLAKGSTAPPPVHDFRKPIALYEKLLKNNPKMEDRDHVLYQLSFCYEQMGESAKSVQNLRLLADSFPESRYLQEVFFRLGEHHFERDEFPQARKYYQRGLDHRTSQLYFLNTLYKLGWTEFLSADFALAADTFRKLLDEGKVGELDVSQRPAPTRPDTTPLGEGTYRDGLMGDALQMMAKSFTEMGGSKSASEYFEKIGDRPYRAEVMRAIGDLYARQDKVAEADAAYDSFLKTFPKHPRALDVMQGWIALHERIGDYSRVATLRMDLVERFSPSSAWMRSNSPEEQKRGELARKQSIAALANYFHHLGQKEKKPEAYAQAVSWYELYLKEYPNEPEALEMEYLLAESLFETQRYEAAGRHYEHVFQNHRDAKRRLEAGTSAFSAYEAQVGQLRKAGKGGEVDPLLERVHTVRKAYEGLDAKPEVVSTMLFKEGDLYYQRKHYNEARDPLETLVKKYPNAKERFSTLRLLALVEYEDQHFDRAAERFSQALTSGTAITAQESRDLHELRASSLFKEAERLKAKKGDVEAAQAFRRVASEEGDSKVASLSLLASGRAYLAAKRNAEGLAALHDLVRRYPNDPNAAVALFEAAEAERLAGQHEAAARDYCQVETLVGKTPQNVEKRKATLLSCAAEWEAAKKPAEVERVLSKLQQSGLLRASEQVETVYRIGQAQMQQGKEVSALASFQRVVELNGKERANEGAYFAGRSQIFLGQSIDRKYRSVQLKPPFQRNLKEKKRLLEATLKAYARATEYRDVEVVTEASYRVGDVLEHFGRALRESPVPKGLSQDEKDRYRALMDEQAFPFEENAIVSYESALRAGREAKTQTEWVKKSLEALARVVPARYAKNEQPLPLPNGEVFF